MSSLILIESSLVSQYNILGFVIKTDKISHNSSYLISKDNYEIIKYLDARNYYFPNNELKVSLSTLNASSIIPEVFSMIRGLSYDGSGEIF